MYFKSARSQHREARLERKWRWLFTICSILTTICGCALIGSTITLYTDGKYEEYYNETQLPLVYLLFFVSWMGAMAGFLAVCIVTIHSYKLFYTMNTLIALVTAAKVAAVCFALVYRVKTLHSVTSQLESRVTNYTTSPAVEWELDALHVSEGCCGAASPLDWSNSTLAVGWTNTSLPDSCCKVVVSGCGEGKANAASLAELSAALNQEGCYEVLKRWFDYRMKIVGVIAGVTSVGEAAVVALSTKWIRFIELR